MPTGHMGVFCKNLVITAYTLENYFNFKNKFLFNNGSILEINDYCNNRSRGNVSFTELSEIIITLSRFCWVGLDKIRLRGCLGKIKEMRVKMNIINKSNRNENCMSDFFSSPFSPVMAKLATASSAGVSASLTLNKRESLESKLLRASSEKNSCLQETAPLLNQCISKENQGRLETDKELKILGKDFKKQVKEKKSLTSKLCQKSLLL